MLTNKEIKKIRELKADIQRYEIKRKDALQRGADVTHFDLIMDGLQQDIDFITDRDEYFSREPEYEYDPLANIPQHLIW